MKSGNLKQMIMNEQITFGLNPEFVKVPTAILKLELVLLDLEPCAMLNRVESDMLIDHYYNKN